MRKKRLIMLVGTAFVLTNVLLLLGCGGGGGPIIPPETGPGPSVSAQFIALLPEA